MDVPSSAAAAAASSRRRSIHHSTNARPVSPARTATSSSSISPASSRSRESGRSPSCGSPPSSRGTSSAGVRIVRERVERAAQLGVGRQQEHALGAGVERVADQQRPRERGAHRRGKARRDDVALLGQVGGLQQLEGLLARVQGRPHAREHEHGQRPVRMVLGEVAREEARRGDLVAAGDGDDADHVTAAPSSSSRRAGCARQRAAIASHAKRSRTRSAAARVRSATASAGSGVQRDQARRQLPGLDRLVVDAGLEPEPARAEPRREDRHARERVVEHLQVRPRAPAHRIQRDARDAEHALHEARVDDAAEVDVGRHGHLGERQSRAADDQEARRGQRLRRGEHVTHRGEVRLVPGAEEERERRVAQPERAAALRAQLRVGEGDGGGIDAVGHDDRALGRQPEQLAEPLAVLLRAHDRVRRRRAARTLDRADDVDQLVRRLRLGQHRRLQVRLHVVRLVDQRQRRAGRERGLRERVARDRGHGGFGDRRERLAVGRREVGVQREADVAHGHPGPRAQQVLRPVVLGGHRHAPLAHAGSDLGDAAALLEGDERDDLDVDAVRRERAVEAEDAHLAPALRREDRERAGHEQLGSRAAHGARGELLHEAVPGHAVRALERGAAHAQACAPRGPELVDRRAQRLRAGIHDAARLAVGDQLGRPARVGAGEHRLAREHRLERDEPVVLLVRDERHGPRAGVQLGQPLARHAPAEPHPRVAFGLRPQQLLVRARAGDPQLDVLRDVLHRLDQQLDALGVVEPAGAEEVGAAARAEALEVRRVVGDEDVGARREVLRASAHGLGDRAVAGDLRRREPDVVEPVHDLADQRAGEREQVGGESRSVAQPLQALEELGKRIPPAGVLLHPLRQLGHRRRRVLQPQREPIDVVGVVEAAQLVLQVDDVPRVAHHPRGVLRRDDEVEAVEVELGEAPVGVDEVPERVLAARQLDQLRLMLGVLVEVVLQTAPEVLGPPDDVRDRAGRDDGDIHADEPG